MISTKPKPFSEEETRRLISWLGQAEYHLLCRVIQAKMKRLMVESVNAAMPSSPLNSYEAKAAAILAQAQRYRECLTVLEDIAKMVQFDDLLIS